MNKRTKAEMHNHLPISKEMEAVMKKHLSAKFSEAEAGRYWKKILVQYEAFLKDLPDFGGKKSRHNGPGGTYDCISLFAYYDVLNHEPHMDELYEMNCEVFLPEFKKMARIVNANNPFLRRLSYYFDYVDESVEKSAGSCCIMR